MRIPFFDVLMKSERILLAGCGGGFDVVNGVPLLVWAKENGKEVVVANLSFSKLPRLCTERVGSAGWIVDRNTGIDDYIPEKYLAEWLGSRGLDPFIVGILAKGVQPLRETYEAIVEKYAIDTILLVDGGTDSLVKGDEPDLATIAEDAASILAVQGVAVERKVLACLGFGVDAFHGISHHAFLENTSEAIRNGGFLGSVSVCAGTSEGDAFLEAVDHLNASQPDRRSIVCNSVASAIRGGFGDSVVVDRYRTAGTELFVNPLMASYWTYDLDYVASSMGFRDEIMQSTTRTEVVEGIRRYRQGVAWRDRKPLPL
jgi:hypothetical protein